MDTSGHVKTLVTSHYSLPLDDLPMIAAVLFWLHSASTALG